VTILDTLEATGMCSTRMVTSERAGPKSKNHAVAPAWRGAEGGDGGKRIEELPVLRE
jgi:hypothetical protein